MFEDRALNGIFETEREKVRGIWIQFRNKDLYDLYSMPYFVRAAKTMRMRAGYQVLFYKLVI
jgi:hypothetical protein